MSDGLLTINEVAGYLKLNRATVQRFCREGKLPAIKFDKSYRVRREELESWIESKRKAA